MSSTPNDTAQPAAPVTAPNTSTGTRRAVLLVEDDRAIRRYLEVILQRAGYDVTAAADGLEGMKAALSSSFDAVVTDAIMPHLNGYELCRFIRRHPKLSATPVVLLSGTDHDARLGASDAQADVYLSKPVRPEELANCVARLVARD